MPCSSLCRVRPGPPAPVALQTAIFSQETTTSERVRKFEALLRGPTGPLLRDQIGQWVVRLLRVEYLVPETYAQWRLPVRDAMFFIASKLSSKRLAPKIVEQIDSTNTAPEMRLLRLIAKVPSLQKLGQVLARNRHLRPSLRRELTKLENGICDVNADEVRGIILDQLGPQLEAYAVRIEHKILAEASVSALMRFTWRNPRTQQRERGVFKVMKPHVPVCFAEDMRLLGMLAKFLGSKRRRYGIASRGISDTFDEVRHLLQHEVQFAREQMTLRKVSRLYGSMPGVRVPRLIRPLCTSKITAMTEERGEKITDAVAHMGAGSRRRVCEQLIEALVAAPMSAPDGDVLFHADPHAGNLLYDKRTGELVLVDWALTERLSREQRRHLALLFLMAALRDPAGICVEIQALSRKRGQQQHNPEVIRKCVARFLDCLPPASVPGTAEAMRLVEQIAYEGIRFPASLIMLRKVLFTLDGILHDIAGPNVALDFVIVRHLLRTWAANLPTFGFPLSLQDWALVQFSTLLYSPRSWMQRAQTLLASTG